MSESIKEIVLKLEKPISAREAQVCGKIIFGGFSDVFDEDGEQMFRPEALVLFRKGLQDFVEQVSVTPLEEEKSK